MKYLPWLILGCGLLGAAFLFGYFYLASFNADITNIALYKASMVISIPFGFFFGNVIGFVISGIYLVCRWLYLEFMR
jgi:uncharacterized membrane protein (DUF485 family)